MADLLPRDEEELLRHNSGLIHTVALRYRRRGELVGLEYDDLVQAASIGLIEAGRRFDSTRGFRFSTYAVACITGVVLRALDTADGQRRGIGVGTYQRLKTLGREIPPMHYSLDACLTADEGHDDLRIEIADPGADPEEQALANLERADFWEAVLARLSPMEREVMRLRYAPAPLSYDEIAQRMGRSKEGMRHIERRSLRKILAAANTRSNALLDR